MFERFTAEAKAVLVEAQDSAIDLGSGYISPGHLFYGCAQGRESTAGEPLRDCGITGESILRDLPRGERPKEPDVDPDALRAIGIDYERVKSAVDETFGEGALESSPDRRLQRDASGRPPFTIEAKRSMELSLRVAQELHARRIEPGHLLLGLLRLDDEMISRVIEKHGASIAGLSATVLQHLDV